MMNRHFGKRIKRSGLMAILTAVSMTFSPLARTGDDGMTPEDIEEMKKMLEGSSKEMDAVLESLDPETRKQLEALTPDSAAEAAKKATRDAKKTQKPVKVDTQPLAPQKLRAHVEALQGNLDKALSPDARKRAEMVDTQMRKTPDYVKHLRTAANAVATMRMWPEATWLLGRLAKTSGDVSDLNNLAAFLIVQGATSPALPILHTLDVRYPDNSTVKNNLGQAYYRMGMHEEAERYLLAAIRVAPAHPQANVTRAHVQLARGEKDAARQSLERAIEGGYGPSKEDDMRRTGDKWKPAKRPWRRAMPQDPLGLEKFVLPEFPQSASDMILVVSAWAQFRRSLADLEAKLEAERRVLTEKLNDPKVLMQSTMKTTRMPFIGQASLAMQADEEHYRQQIKTTTVPMQAAMQKHRTENKRLHDTIERLRAANEKKYYNDPVGEDAHRCDGVPEAYDAYVKNSNPDLEVSQRAYLEVVRKHANDTSYMAQFVEPTPDTFALVKNAMKFSYVHAMNQVNVAIDDLKEGDKPTCLSEVKVGKKTGKLPDFNDIHCEYVTQVEVPNFGSMTFRCDTAEATFAPSFAPFEASWKLKNTGRSDETMLVRASAAVSIDAVKIGGHSEFDEKGIKSGGVSATVGVDVGKLSAGPLQVGVEASATAGLEFDGNGLSDVVINAGVESKASSTVAKTEAGGQMKSGVKAGLDSTWSWNSGLSGGTSAGFSSSVFQ